MSQDDLLRAGAVLAAMALLFSDTLLAATKSAISKRPRLPVAPPPAPAPAPAHEAEEDPSLADMRLVLDLAARLRADGCDAGVSLCQQLLDVMLGSPRSQSRGKK